MKFEKWSGGSGNGIGKVGGDTDKLLIEPKVMKGKGERGGWSLSWERTRREWGKERLGKQLLAHNSDCWRKWTVRQGMSCSMSKIAKAAGRGPTYRSRNAIFYLNEKREERRGEEKNKWARERVKGERQIQTDGNERVLANARGERRAAEKREGNRVY